MKQFWGFFLVLVAFTQVLKADTLTAQDLRSKIGTTFSAPVSYNGKYFFVATTGVLYESDKEFKQIQKLYEGKRQSIGSLTLVENMLFWGDGLHTDQKSTLHVFDLKSKKLLKDIEVEGHIERAPLIHDGMIYLPAGAAGILALDLKDHKMKWATKTHANKKLHIDSNILVAEKKICATSVYELKGIVCLDPKTGKVLQLGSLARDPKSEITLWKNHVVGFATEGDLMKAKFDVPSDLYVYDVASDKVKLSKELRGFNFFAPVINGDDAFVTLSTGDFINVNLVDGKIQFMGEFPEPFTNNSFMKGEAFCGVGIMGKFMCYSKTRSGFALSTDKRLMETVIGKVLWDNGKLVAPTRVGYYFE